MSGSKSGSADMSGMVAPGLEGVRKGTEWFQDGLNNEIQPVTLRVLV